jgi:hypothetical protein
MPRSDELFEWRERIGTQLMFRMTCTHDGEAFGNGAVCVTCFTNTQRIGALIEDEVATARADGLRLGIEYVESFQSDYASAGHVLNADGALHALRAALSSLTSATEATR